MRRQVRISKCTVIEFCAVTDVRDDESCYIKIQVVREDDARPASDELLSIQGELFSDIEHIYSVTADDDGVTVKFAVEHRGDTVLAALDTMVRRVERRIAELMGQKVRRLVTA